MASNHLDSDQGLSGVAQTANLGSSTSVSSGAAKIFREFKWGLLTLFILMAVVVGLVYDGGHNKKKNDSLAGAPGPRLDAGMGIPEPNLSGENNTNLNPNNGNGGTVAGGLGGGNSTLLGTPGDKLPGRSRAQLLDDGPDAWNPAPIPDQHITQPTRGVNAPSNGARSADAAGDDSRGAPRGSQTDGKATDTRRGESHGQAAPRSPENAGTKIYLVKAGDSLSKIASANSLGKNGVKLLIDANKDTLPNPDRLREGMKLHIPGAGSASSNAEAASKPGAAKELRGPSEVRSEKHAAGSTQSDTYVVQPGDTLERIARRVLNDGHRWKELVEWNKEKLPDPTKLRAGMALKIHGASNTPAGAGAPATAESVRYQNNTVRAEAEPSVEPPFAPEAEVAPLPISPVSASRKISMQNDKFERGEKRAPSKSAKLPEPDNLPNALLLN